MTCSYYLTESAEAARAKHLIERIATSGLRPGESVPQHILAAAMAQRSDANARAA